MEPPNLEGLPSWAAELLRTAPVARLGLVDQDGAPRVLPVTFALAEGRIWSAVDDKPKRPSGKELARLRYLRRDPRAALTLDRYSDDWGKLAWVQVLGEVAITAQGSAASGLEALTAKYPQYRASPPPGPVLELTPGRCLFWRAGGA